jgi:hypothetical protein
MSQETKKSPAQLNQAETAGINTLAASFSLLKNDFRASLILDNGCNGWYDWKGAFLMGNIVDIKPVVNSLDIEPVGNSIKIIDPVGGNNVEIKPLTNQVVVSPLANQVEVLELPSNQVQVAPYTNSVEISIFDVTAVK